MPAVPALLLLLSTAHAAELRPVGLASVDAFFTEVQGIATQVEVAEGHVDRGRERVERGDQPGARDEVAGAWTALLAAAPRLPGLVQAAIVIPAELTDETALLEIPPWKMPIAVRNLIRNVIETARLPSRVKTVVGSVKELAAAAAATVDLNALEDAGRGESWLELGADAETAPKWSHGLGGPRPGIVHIGDAGILVAGSPRGMIAVDGETGEELWRREEAPPMRAVVGETAGYPLFLFSSCRATKRKERCTWTMVDLFTGETRWTRPMSDGQVVLLPGTDRALLVPWEAADPRPLEAIDVATNAVVWSDDTLRLPPAALLDGRALTPALAPLASTHLLQCEGDTVGLRAIRDGTLKWSWRAQAPLACETARFEGDVVTVLDTGGALHGLDGGTGDARWALTGAGPPDQTIARAAGDAVVVATRSKSGETRLRTLAAADGTPRGDEAVLTEPVQLVVAGDRVLTSGASWTVGEIDLATGAHTVRAAVADGRKGDATDAELAGGRLVVRGVSDLVALDLDTWAVAWDQQVVGEKPTSVYEKMMSPSMALGTRIGRAIAEGYARPDSPRQQGDYLFQRSWGTVGKVVLATVTCIDKDTGEVAGEVLVTGDLWPYRLDDIGDAVYGFQYKNPAAGTGGVQITRHACGVKDAE